MPDGHQKAAAAAAAADPSAALLTVAAILVSASAIALTYCDVMSSSSAPAAAAASGGLLDGHRFRSSWARAAYHKIQFDSQHLTDDRHPEWYRLEKPHLLPADLAASFTQLSQDAETKEFLAQSFAKSERLLTQLYHRLAKPLLSLFMSVTSANGLLRRGSMFVLSGRQFRQLLTGLAPQNDVAPQQQQQQQPPPPPPPPHMEALLDLGAGDGNVTARYAGYFRRVYVTELATVMTWRLSEHGFTVVDPNTWRGVDFTSAPNDDVTTAASDMPPGGSDDVAVNGGYDVIGCLNLLDRCEAPLDLLAQARRMLKPGTGRLLLAIVIPVRQFCEFAAGNRPAQALGIRGATFEEQVASLEADLFRPQGWQVERWAKAPYLCEGDLYQSFYHLTDAVFVLRPQD